MNDEELKKAVDIIINKPIIIQNMTGEDNKEYIGFDKENFETLEQTYYNCQYFARNQEQLMINLKDKDKEIKRLKELEATLWQQNDNLQKRINRAIELIENNLIEYSDFQYVDNDDELDIDCESIKELFDILKGSDNE